MIRLVEARTEGINMLKSAEIEYAEQDAWLLLSFVTGITKSQFFLKMYDVMDESKYLQYKELIALRMTHRPLQQITHSMEFMGIDFFVNEDVLIPRQDTEVLVEQAISLIQKREKKTRVLDLCCGSGCIGLSVEKFTGADVVLSDLSEKALLVTEENKKRLHTKAQIRQGDLFEALGDEKFDFILSNPPYIATNVIETLMPEVREFEPMMALDGAEDGLLFYRRIVKEAPFHLLPEGWLLFEIGYDQGESVSQLLKEHGFEQINIVKDYAGLDRVVLGQLQESTQKPAGL